jgi:NAD(P)-dependent dehydrogenase (short-subunit alcohol dehydrogenase family)
MDFKDKVIVVTGGANGIGRSLCQRLALAEAKVAVMDIEIDKARELASSIGGFGLGGDVGIESDIKNAILEVERALGPIDIFISNAGVAFGDGPDWMAASASNKSWEISWRVNVMAHVYAARELVPKMIRRGGGYLVNIASGASMLCQIGDAAYSATKSAALGFAESLAITHGHDNINVSVVCPLYVATRMTEGGRGVSGTDDVMSADSAAEAIIQGILDNKFLIMPHEELGSYTRRKYSDYDRWLEGMKDLRARMIQQNPNYDYQR